MTKKSAMTFLGLALNWKWHHPPPPFGNSTEIHLIWCGYPSLMCIYKISFIRVYLSIYCLQPAGCIFIKSYFFATTSTNQPPSPPDRPTNHRPSVLSPSPTINPVFLYLPYPTINHDNQDDQPSIKSFLHLQYDGQSDLFISQSRASSNHLWNFIRDFHYVVIVFVEHFVLNLLLA